MTASGQANADVRSQGLVAKFARQLKTRGVLGASRHVARRLHAQSLEWWLGIQTHGSIHATELGSEGTRFGYQPIDYHSFFTAMSHVELTAQDVFADYGCGLGRAVVLAARYPIKRVFGVELSSRLCTIAEENVKRALPKLRTTDVSIVCADATKFTTPDDLTLMFMYNPFGDDVLQEAMMRIYESLERCPRHLRIIYALPRSDRDALAELSWLQRVDSVQTANHDWERISIYENVALRTAEFAAK